MTYKRASLSKTALTKSLCISFNKLLNLATAFHGELLHIEKEQEHLNSIINVHTAENQRNKPVAFVLSISMIQYSDSYTENV